MAIGGWPTECKYGWQCNLDIYVHTVSFVDNCPNGRNVGSMNANIQFASADP